MEDKKRSLNPEYLVSIVIVTFNAEKYIERCLTRIADLGLSSVQIVIIDGGSTDNTKKIIKKFDQVDIFISEPDEGIYYAMNKAIDYVEGKWIYFIGSDDQLLPGFKVMLLHLKNENEIYYGNCLTDVRKLGQVYSSYFLTKDIICHQSIFYPRVVFKKFGYRYQVKFRVLADYVLNMQCWGDNRLRKVYVPIDIAHYSLEGYSSYTSDKLLKKDKSMLVRKYLGWMIYFRYMFRKFKAFFKGNADTF